MFGATPDIGDAKIPLLLGLPVWGVPAMGVVGLLKALRGASCCCCDVQDTQQQTEVGGNINIRSAKRKRGDVKYGGKQSCSKSCKETTMLSKKDERDGSPISC